jgi:hypothetical protein
MLEVRMAVTIPDVIRLAIEAGVEVPEIEDSITHLHCR